MRRALLIVVAAFLAASASACSGPDAQEAQALLAESNAAFAQVRSATFTARLTVTGGPTTFSMTLNGGGYAHGKRAGDTYVLVTGDGLPFNEVAMIKRHGRTVMRVDGHPIPVPAPPASAANPLQLVDLADYVNDVHVDHGKVLESESEPLAKVTAVLDTGALAEGALAQLASGTDGFDLSAVLGDTRVVLYLSERTHLPKRGLLDFALKVGDQKIDMHMDFAYTSYNKRVEFPSL